MEQQRAQWGSRFGFILAAAGSAVGLGNVWKFPYITGENGGGIFVLIYLLCIGIVGLPIMIGEVLIGRSAQSSTVTAFRKLQVGRGWPIVGWIGVTAGFVILSYYSVVAGWAIHYVGLSLSGAFAQGQNLDEVSAHFGAIASNGGLSFLWHSVFMAMTIAIVIVGVQKGVERAAKVLMPTLFCMLGAMMIYATTLDGFGRAFDFVFGFHTEQLKAASVLEAMGHSFFTLSVGMGAMLTFGSYLKKGDSIVGASIAIAILDTLVALMACLVLFPITFSQGMDPSAGPGLVFQNMPMAFAQLPGGSLWAVIFFVLLVFAALTSAISLLEVAAAYFIDERGWSRKKAVTFTGTAIFILGIPSAFSNGDYFFGSQMAEWLGKSWFDAFDYVASNWMLPLGGLGIAFFVSWGMDVRVRQTELEAGSSLAKVKAVYLGWLWLMRWLVPVAIVLVMLNALGLLGS